MKITMLKMFYTIHELAERWEVSVDEIADLMFLGFFQHFGGLTSSLTPTLFASRMGLRIPLTLYTLKNASYIVGSGKIFYKDVEITPIFPEYEINRIETECTILRGENQHIAPKCLDDYAKAAFSKFWKNAVENERDTHPKNKDVENWLVENQNLSKRKSAQIATLIRPEWASKAGRHPK
ncbi:hypothetical protein [Limnohabitans sp.]